MASRPTFRRTCRQAKTSNLSIRRACIFGPSRHFPFRRLLQPGSNYGPGIFWCGANGVNGQPLQGCINHLQTYPKMTDTQIGYDAILGRWIATQMALDDSTGQGVLYVAASTTGTAGGVGTWETWSENPCTNPNSPAEDQPLLGWSSSAIVIDTKCYNNTTKDIGNDSLIIIPNYYITTQASAFPAPTPAPCKEMAPARDEQGNFSSLYLLASIVPGSPNLAYCAPASNNTEPYIVEYTATTSGVFGVGGCTAGNADCAPVSESPQYGNAAFYRLVPNAQQSGCGSASNCTVDL